ncbi:MAG TPA: hypothetical protein DEH25_06810 [Chloroflexi bacterium]|nr:hypothetical protein [Chloroflexota bacterium]
MPPIYVIVVDSDPRFLEIATQFLQKREGVMAWSAISSGDAVIRQVRVFEPDMILYTLGDSDPNNLQTISKLRAMFPNLNIVVFASPESENRRQETIEAGANDFYTRNEISLSLLPAFWQLVTFYQQRYSKQQSNNFDLGQSILPPAPKGLDCVFEVQ